MKYIYIYTGIHTSTKYSVVKAVHQEGTINYFQQT